MIIHFNTPGESFCRAGRVGQKTREGIKMPGMGKMKHVSLTLQVENDLKHQLSIGALKPGACSITKNLAEQLGMSITPVREALLRLVSVNALSVAPAQAFTVPEVGKRQLDEINRIR